MNFNDVKYIDGVTKVIVPFQFDYKNYDERNDDIVSEVSKSFIEKLKLDKYVYTNAKGKKVQPFIKISLIPNNLYGELDSIMRNNNKYIAFGKDNNDPEGDNSKIVDIYELKRDDAREEFLLHKNPNIKYECKYVDNGIEKKIVVSIENIRVFLFETLDGFLEYECKYEAENADDYLNTNFSLCEINNEKYKFTYKKKVSKDEEIDCSFTLKEISNKIFEILGKDNIHNFDEHITSDEVSFTYHPQIFSYVLFDKKPSNTNDINELLFNIRKNFKGSFKFPTESINSDKYTYQSFDNSYWAFSLNAAVNVSFLTDDDATDKFFKEQFESSILSTYYFLYMCVLNQRYGIIIQKGKLGQLDEYGGNYMKRKLQLKKTQFYKTNALKFKYKAFFKSPSEEEHINDYFRKLSISQNIYESYTSFVSDLNDTETIYSTLLKKANDDQDEIKKVSNYEQDMFIALIGNVVAICQLLMAKAALLGNGIKWYDMIINAILVILPILTMIMNTNSKIEAIYAIVKDKGADATKGKTKEEKIVARKNAIKEKFQMTSITRFFVFRMIDNDKR